MLRFFSGFVTRARCLKMVVKWNRIYSWGDFSEKKASASSYTKKSQIDKYPMGTNFQKVFTELTDVEKKSQSHSQDEKNLVQMKAG